MLDGAALRPRSRKAPRANQGEPRALYRRDGRSRQEFLQQLRQELRLRGSRVEAPRPLSLETEERGRGRSSNELVDAVALVGTRERIKDQLEQWNASAVT